MAGQVLQWFRDQDGKKGDHRAGVVLGGLEQAHGLKEGDARGGCDQKGTLIKAGLMIPSRSSL